MLQTQGSTSRAGGPDMPLSLFPGWFIQNWLTCFITSCAGWLGNMLHNTAGTLWDCALLTQRLERVTEALEQHNSSRHRRMYRENTYHHVMQSHVCLGNSPGGCFRLTTRTPRNCSHNIQIIIIIIYFLQVFENHLNKRWGIASDEWNSFWS